MQEDISQEDLCPLKSLKAASSIKARGIVQPIVVRASNSGRYEL